MFSINVAVPLSLSLSLRLQLLFELSRGRHFEGWQEGLITFSPTYKYQPNSDQYHWCFDSAGSDKKRAPAWSARFSCSRRSFAKERKGKKTRKKKKKKLFDNKQQKSCTLNPADGHAFFPFVIAGAIAFCGEARG